MEGTASSPVVIEPDPVPAEVKTEEVKTEDQPSVDLYSLPVAQFIATGANQVSTNKENESNAQPLSKKLMNRLNKARAQKIRYQPFIKIALASEACHGKTLMAEYDRGSSLINLDVYFITFKKKKPLKAPLQIDLTLVKDWDSSHVEKRVLGKIGTMLGVMIEPVLEWGFVGHHLREAAKQRGQLKVMEKLTARVAWSKKPDEPEEPDRPGGRTDKEMAELASPSLQPEVPPGQLPEPVQPPSTVDKGSQTQDDTEYHCGLHVSTPSDKSGALPGDDTTRLLVAGLQQLKENEGRSVDTEVDPGLHQADEELADALREQRGIQFRLITLRMGGLPQSDTPGSAEYCQLLEEVERNAERIQRAAQLAQPHAERVYRVREKEWQAARNQADAFLSALGDEWLHNGRQSSGKESYL